jgi:hypothetical protein
MKFLDVTHPEGGRFLVHIDHITSAHYRPGGGDVKTRLAFDLDNRQNDVIIFGEEAERTWKKLQQLLGDS